MAYSQNDPTWAGLTLGTSSVTVGNSGCYVTSFANVALSFQRDVTPQWVNDQLLAKGLYLDGGDVADDYLQRIMPDIRYIETQYYGGPASLGYIAQASKPNTEIIVGIDATKFGVPVHFCRVVEVRENEVIIDDSWDGVRRSISERYGNARTMILKAVKYQAEVNMGDKMTELGIRIVWRQMLGEDPKQKDINAYLGKSLKLTTDDIYASDKFKEKQQLATAGKLDMSQFATYALRSASGSAYPGQPTADQQQKMLALRNTLNISLGVK